MFVRVERSSSFFTRVTNSIFGENKDKIIKKKIQTKNKKKNKQKLLLLISIHILCK